MSGKKKPMKGLQKSKSEERESPERKEAIEPVPSTSGLGTIQPIPAFGGQRAIIPIQQAQPQYDPWTDNQSSESVESPEGGTEQRLLGGADNNQAGPSREEGGGRRRRVRRQPPGQEEMEPINRPVTLTQDRIARARILISELKVMADFEVNDTLCLLAYQNLLQNQPEDYDPSVIELLEVSKMIHDEQGSWEMRANYDIADPFLDQLFHMLKLAGLSHRSWNMLISSVFFDDSEENIKLITRVVFASRYQGFDPSVILRKLIKSWQEGRRAPHQSFVMHYEGERGSEEWSYTNQEHFMNDMTVLVLCFLNRGAVVGKILKKSAKDYNALMRMLIAKYNIRSNEETERRRRAEALGPEVITLPRIAACLCQLTTELYSRGFGRAIANFNEFGQVPTALFSPMFSSVVRKGYLDENGIIINLHPQLMLINILVDNVLHVRDKVTPLDQIWTYFLASYNSGVLLDTARVQQCNKFGITVEGKFIPPLLALREHCIRRIRELRPHERIDDFIREMNQLY